MEASGGDTGFEGQVEAFVNFVEAHGSVQRGLGEGVRRSGDIHYRVLGGRWKLLEALAI